MTVQYVALLLHLNNLEADIFIISSHPFEHDCIGFFVCFVSGGSCQRSAVLCDHHSGVERFMSAGSHLGEDPLLGKWLHLSCFAY